MGIPFYFREIVSKYPSIIVNSIPHCDRYFVDFNSIIHQCAAKVVEAHPHAFTFEMMAASIVEATRQAIAQAAPSQVAYLAVDGVAPRAKMAQQRKRRYMAGFRNDAIREFCERSLAPAHTTWDSNAITPGTEFMDRLDVVLAEAFKSSDPCEVVVSGSNEPGEGEQKLFDYMRAHPQPGAINVISGLDADLIMLSLLSEETIYLQRDALTYVDVTEFRRCISMHTSGTNDIAFMRDYVFMCFLLGNDFLPHLPFITIREGGVGMLMDVYKQVHGDMQQHIVTQEQNECASAPTRPRFGVNMAFLKQVFKRLSEMEPETMVYACNQYTHTLAVQKHVPSVPDMANKALKRFLVNLEQLPVANKHPLTKGPTPGTSWALEYYHEFFGDNSPTEIKQYSRHYVDGLLWVTNYYFNRKYDTFWHYPHTLSPLAADIYKTLVPMQNEIIVSSQNKLMRNTEDFEVKPVLQLACVLPPSSSNLLPAHVRPIMLDAARGAMHYFPRRFRLCTFMKRYLWECTPVLPDIDIVDVWAKIQASTD